MQLKLRASRHCVAAALAALLLAQTSVGADTPPTAALSAETLKKIDTAVTEVLKKTRAPSASIAIVQDGRTVYQHGYGDARLEPKLPAEPGMRLSTHPALHGQLLGGVRGR
jgi:CubicO group peptidase (beta-lactamase class C family)